MNRFSLEGKLALITGATRGIGLGAARALAESGSGVILVGRDEAQLQLAADGLRQLTKHVHVATYDLVQVEGIGEWFNNLCATTGTPDILVNSAGITRRGPAVDLSLKDFNEVMTVNNTAIFELSRTFARRLIAEGRGGRVINIASLMTSVARPEPRPTPPQKEPSDS